MPSMNIPYRQDMRFQSWCFWRTGLSMERFQQTGYRCTFRRVTVEDERADSQVKGFNTKLEKTLPSAFVRWENQHPEHDLKAILV